MNSLKKFIVIMALSLLVACSAKNSIENAYPLVDVLNDEVGNESSVYLAEGSSVSETAKKIAGANEPVEISKEDEEKMFLVYDDYLVQVMQDEDTPPNSLVEVSEDEFVRRNFSPSLLEAYGMYAIVNSLFNLGNRNRNNEQYGGYVGSGGSYHKSGGSIGSVRGQGSTSRGGGPGFGK